MYEMMPSDVFGFVFSGALPIGEDMVSRVPKLILLGAVDEAEPPVDHLSRTVGHVGGSRHMVHVVRGEAVPGLDRKIIILQQGWCVFETKHVRKDLGLHRTSKIEESEEFLTAGTWELENNRKGLEGLWDS